MSEHNIIQEVFFKFLMQYKYDEKDLDYSSIPKYISTFQILSDIGNSGISVFDINKKEMAFYSANYGKLLGYVPSDYAETSFQFFDDKIHPDDKPKLVLNGISILKMFNQFSSDEKLNHKLINEYRMLNAQQKYIRLIEQHQILALDKKGQVWLLLGIVDISPNQEENDHVKSQLLNFRTGSFIPFEVSQKADLELTKREIEILKLVKEGLLSKEISDKLSISVHTVNTHRQRFLEKLGANNSMEAVMFASKFGLLD
ncbi:helix-turn-helix transcriptional regulator [Emticicia aquatilis]|uniref:Helix-turn-helix transcriptional regulator n=1 Tax=Emticicia aquatilis TaxID=1537369 RepID=A0A917DXG3_9BACT|nr:LuxR C-terminal-related transcriptional regulator [Emticicia aquatilis]GGD80786.1 helix-turn-helix transcriptional regulator [Emticicia aquatilis]